MTDSDVLYLEQKITAVLDKLLEENKKSLEEFQQTFLERTCALQALDLSRSEEILTPTESQQDSNDRLQAKMVWLEDEIAELRRLNEERTQPSKEAPPGVEETRSSPTIGQFCTTDAQTTKDLFQRSKLITFSNPYSNPPRLTLGLAVLDIGKEPDPRISCFASLLTKEHFEIKINGSANTKIYKAACTWLELEPDDPDFQSGSFSTLEDLPWQCEKLPLANERRITFPRSYAVPPQVIVWLSAFDVSREHSWRFKTYTSDVTATGFTIHIDTWGSTVLRFVTVSWVSFTSGKDGVSCGSFNTSDMRPSSCPQTYNSGFSAFQPGFKHPPRVAVALSSLEIDRRDNLRLSVSTSAVSATGMMWHLNSWAGTKLFSAGASYIAFS